MRTLTQLLLATSLVIGNAALAADTADPVAGKDPLAASVERLAPLLTDPDDPLLRQELRQALHAAYAAGYFALFVTDPAHPDFWPAFSTAFPFFALNPDDSYFEAPIDDDGVYRISGYRGTVRIVDFQIAGGPLLPLGEGSLGETYANYDLDRDVKLGPDGSFEVILSRTRPQGHTGDWWKLAPGATYVLARQIALDWRAEVDGRFAIERLDVPAAKPRLSAAQIDAKLERLASFAESWIRASLRFVEATRAKVPANDVRVRDYNADGGLTTQRYIEGLFDLKPDEALIYETAVPDKCRYWNIQLTDELWRYIDPMHRQTTLNAHSATIDADGRLRAVIAARDPGVPNWLDTAGYARGQVFGRWTECSSYPKPKVTKVKLSEVRKHLPRDTARVSREQRDAQLRERREAAQLRRRW